MGIDGGGGAGGVDGVQSLNVGDESCGENLLADADRLEGDEVVGRMLEDGDCGAGGKAGGSAVDVESLGLGSGVVMVVRGKFRSRLRRKVDTTLEDDSRRGNGKHSTLADDVLDPTKLFQFREGDSRAAIHGRLDGGVDSEEKILLVHPTEEVRDRSGFQDGFARVFETGGDFGAEVGPGLDLTAVYEPGVTWCDPGDIRGVD